MDQFYWDKALLRQSIVNIVVRASDLYYTARGHILIYVIEMDKSKPLHII